MGIHVLTSIANHVNKWSMGTHHHADYEISIVLEGAATFQSGDGDYPMEKGSVVIIPPDIPHRFWTGDSVRFGVLQISPLPKYLSERFYELAEPSRAGVVHLTLMNKEAYESLFINWLKFISQELRERDACISAWIELFLLILLQQQIEAPRMTISTAAHYIHNHFNKEIRISELAKLAGLSVSAFRKEFTKIYEVSPKQYQQMQRLSEGKWLLRSSDYSIAQIAERLGFSSIHLFSAWFQQMENAAPSIWRKRQQGEQISQSPLERF